MNNDINVNIKDHPIIKTNIANNIKISTVNVVLFTSITLRVGLYTNNILVDNQMITLSGQEYNDWGNDDNYIVNTVLTKLNLTRA